MEVGEHVLQEGVVVLQEGVMVGGAQALQVEILLKLLPELLPLLLVMLELGLLVVVVGTELD